MAIADPRTYLKELMLEMDILLNKKHFNFVCHGHSVPAGFSVDPLVETFIAYPHLWHREIKKKCPFTVINVITTAIGGENSQQGSERFDRDVLGCNPRVITLDYILNDIGLGVEKAEMNWRSMIDRGLAAGAKMILLTPTLDLRDPAAVEPFADMVRNLAAEYGIGLVDSMRLYLDYEKRGGSLADLQSISHHPNARGHRLVADGLTRWLSVVPSRYHAERDEDRNR